MAKVSTQHIVLDRGAETELNFKYDVNVDKEGCFSTTLPVNIVELFKQANIDLSKNRLGNEGYLNNKTLEGLKKEVLQISEEYLSRELIDERIVIKYVIQTQCSYAKDKDGNICPNPSKEWTVMGYGHEPGAEENNKWHNGTISMHAASRHPYGLQIYIEPFVKRSYRYKSGKEKIECTKLCYGGNFADESLKTGYYLRWLDSVTSMTYTSGMKIKEVDYSEVVAEFFVNMVKSICNINEKIKDFLEPEMILKIAESRTKFLG